MALLFARVALSCGLNWSEPSCKIPGCNEQGYVLIAEKLAELNIPDEKEPIPIWATFDSSRQTVSPYAGMGWRIPLLECSLVQLSENEFQLNEPGGWRHLFRRTGKDSNILDGGGSWKGQLSTDHATLWADCGWRIDLHKGKIVQLKTAHGQTLNYNYTNGRIASITCGMKTLVAVDPDEGQDHTLGIAIDGKRYSLARADQPRVQRVAGVNVIGGNDLSFNQFTGPERQTRTFRYSVDDQTRPLLTITDASNQDTIVSWDPETRRITRYGEWKYDIKPDDALLANAAIGRTSTNGQSEFWHYSQTTASETYQGVDGIKTVTSQFITGKLAGLKRKTERYVGKDCVYSLKYFYNEQGELIRENETEDGHSLVRHFSYDDKKRLLSVSENGTKTFSDTFDEQGRVVDRLRGGIRTLTNYLTGGERIDRTHLNNGGSIFRAFDSRGALKDLCTDRGLRLVKFTSTNEETK